MDYTKFKNYMIIRYADKHSLPIAECTEKFSSKEAVFTQVFALYQSAGFWNEDQCFAALQERLTK
jgi:hypothetical protein